MSWRILPNDYDNWRLDNGEQDEYPAEDWRAEEREDD